ncbi:BREX-1 system adenine-specific DNA-methyltransferase PglX [Mucilaginibacter segetis]|uniref:site-specific DNA-methyltransferase (adenine-specific) n=1 Tax=Mucilaginibacter segetis TaxID=2793071 RepID=A0A934PVA2_9SPHI|nr:BREX-1 system adenine-specific DNA-methyltransferase PglX [Mucilaginibacter segetis]MBK0380055.1 BREX-1 system adenine-specific DNA-methyltransferase PglX [Mucilaginibacter segetis]
MKLAEHVELIRKLIDTAFRNRLGRMGVTASVLQPVDAIPAEYRFERKSIEGIREVWIAETGTVSEAYEKLVEEFTFTLFNRLAALKVMEAHILHPEIITRRTQHGDRSFAHKHWLEQNPDGRNEEMEGLVRFIEDQLTVLTTDIPLFSPQHPYHLLPTAIELNGIMNAFNQVETDPQVESDIWKSDDVLGWLYESYNNYKKAAHKESGDKTEFNKVSIQSQVYTPRWVVKFLVDNSLGKLYLEMFPDSEIKNRYKIANAPKTQTRAPKPITEIKLIDPATGSGNFLLYGFDLFYDLYIDQIENYGAEYDERKIAELIITNNLHGVDLDDRAIQLAQLGLYIKAKRKKRSAKIEHFNIVSSDFFLPPYSEVKHIFEESAELGEVERNLMADLWGDLQNAYKFGALIRLEEKLNLKWFGTKKHVDQNQIALFGQENLDDFENFRELFFINLHKAVTQNTAKQGQTFLNTKTQDAITFLQLLTQKYDVAVANPPYTDSSDFGPELKVFIDTNYKQPYKFNSNLYATFIKRSFELIDEQGKMALIHPLTFMYIKTFEDVRKFIIDKLHINIFVDYGLSNLFGSVMVDPAFYVLEKEIHSNDSLFISLDQYTRTPNEKFKKDFCLKSLDDYIANIPNKHNITLPQSKLKIIESWPFIYWISDGFREKFKEKTILDMFNPAQGAATTDNNKFLRFWWEVEENSISINYNEDKRKWVKYSKGGPFNKWYGNLWVLLNWGANGQDLISAGAVLRNSNFYLQEGITYSASGSKGASYRYLPSNCIFDTGGSCIFLGKTYKNLNYLIAFLNSPLSTYIVDCLNPTVNTQVGDLQRIPIVKPSKSLENGISVLANENIIIKKNLCEFKLVETNYKNNPLTLYSDVSLTSRLLTHLNGENAQLTHVLINEAVINNLIFEVYDLSEQDRQQIEAKMGRPVGELPVLNSARQAYLEEIKLEEENVINHIENLRAIDFEESQILPIKIEFNALYQSNNDLEEFCIRHQVNPINVWFWFKESKILPQGRAADIALEFLADSLRTILKDDEDGIIPLVALPGEPKLADRLEQHCFSQGFNSAQFMQLDALIGRPINEYIEQHFFKDLSDHLNLFMYLPKTPFIWHLSSGAHQGFEAYIIIYKWNRDSLYKLKSSYLSKRTESLQYRNLQIGDSVTAQAQTEKEIIRLQLQEIAVFSKKIDELIAEGYDPKLDGGVGKNIAPLQKKGMLKAEVLKSTQLQKYLNADW